MHQSTYTRVKRPQKKSNYYKQHKKNRGELNEMEDERPCGAPTFTLVPASPVEWTVGQKAEIILNRQVEDLHIEVSGVACACARAWVHAREWGGGVNAITKDKMHPS